MVKTGFIFLLCLMFGLSGCFRNAPATETVVDIHILSPQSTAIPGQPRTNIPEITKVELEIQGDGMNQSFSQALQLVTSTERKIRTILPLGKKSIVAKGYGTNNKLLASDSQSLTLEGGEEYTLILKLKEPKDQQPALPAVEMAAGSAPGTSTLNNTPGVAGTVPKSTASAGTFPTDTSLLDKRPPLTGVLPVNGTAPTGTSGQTSLGTSSVFVTSPGAPVSNGVTNFISGPQQPAMPLLLSLPAPPVPTPSSTPGLTNNAPVITNITALNSQGTHLLLTGERFDVSPGNNTVRFGSLLATVNAATTSSLDVNVTLTNGTYPVTVTVGTNVSNVISLTNPIPVALNNQLPVINTLTADPPTLSGLAYPTEITANVTDSDNTLTDDSYSWSCDGGCGSFNQINGSKVIWTAPTQSGGLFTIRVAVADGVNLPVQGTLQIYVTSGIGNINVNAR